MSQDSPLLRELREALESAFPTHQALEMMVFDQLEENLSSITRTDTLEYTVFNLIKWAVAKGRLEELVIGALKQSGQNPQLISVAKQLEARNDQNPNLDVPMDEPPQNIPTSSVIPSGQQLSPAPHPLTNVRSRLAIAVIGVVLIVISIIVTVAVRSGTLSPIPPSVHITSPSDGDHVHRSVTIEGTASNIPNDKQLWILIAVDGVKDDYFPQHDPVSVGKDGKWSSLITVGTDADHDKKFVLYAALVDATGKIAIDKYLVQTPNPNYIGIHSNSLQGIELTSYITVIRI